MRFLPFIVGLIPVAMGIVMVLVRQVDHDPAQWHVDPLEAPKPSTPNSYRVAPDVPAVDADAESTAYERPVAQLAADFDRIARGDERVKVIAGSVEERFITYVQTSALFAFPDYISVRFLEVDDNTSTLAVFSRSRFGQSDLGVNKKRVQKWLSELSS